MTGRLRQPAALRLAAALFLVVATEARGWFDPATPSASGYIAMAVAFFALARVEEIAEKIEESR